VAAINRYQKF